MTTIFDLPADLVEEIISRVSLISMRAVRSTCKKLDTLSKSQSFTKMHISKVAAAAREGEFQAIMLMNDDLYLQTVFFNGIDVDPSIESIVWNPYLGQTRWVKPRYFHRGQSRQFIDRCFYALGYENKKNNPNPSHKILRFTNHVYPTGNIYAAPKEFFWYEIYDFDSGLWTTLDVTPQWDIFRGVSLKGNTYFCARKRESYDEGSDYIICFDFTREIFGPLMRMPFYSEPDDYVSLSCVKEEKLAVLLTHNESNPWEIEVWITTMIAVEKVSWSKFLKLNTKPEYPISPGSFLIDEEKKVVMGFDEDDLSYVHHILSIVGEAGYLKQLNLLERTDISSRFTINMWSYVPSLVQIKQNAGGKRKKQSSLETRRFDQKKTRLVALEKPINERYGLRPRKEKN